MSFPSLNELVVCKVKTIKNFGVFVELLEYAGREGFVHVSQVAPGWIKNIRSHVSEGQIRVAQVVSVDQAKGLVDVSFRKVTSGLEKRKLSDYKLSNRAAKLFERAAQQLKEDPAKSYALYAEPLKTEFGSLYAAFEALNKSGAAAIKTVKLPKQWLDKLAELAATHIATPEVTIRRTLTIRANTGDGAVLIKNALLSLEKAGISVTYISAPDYMLTVTAEDYPEAEKILKKALEPIEKDFKKVGELSIEGAKK